MSLRTLLNAIRSFFRRGGRRSDSSDTIRGVDLREALQILQHAGYPEPTDGVRSERDQVEYVLHALCELTIHDGLTGLVNARHFGSTLEQEVERSFRTGLPCSLLLIDLDHFKTVNDRYGHLTGDHVLRTVGRVIRSGTRSMDTAARYGGEEFAVILPNTTLSSALRIAERLRRQIAQEAVSVDNTVVHVTCSIGLACLDSPARSTGAALMKLADEQLYRAKQLGRNRVCADQGTAIAVSTDERLALSRHAKTQEDRTWPS